MVRYWMVRCEDCKAEFSTAVWKRGHTLKDQCVQCRKHGNLKFLRPIEVRW